MKKLDGRGEGLNSKGFPLRKIIEKKADSHLLECGHSLRPVSSAAVRSRRCPECVGESLDVLAPVKSFIDNIVGNKKTTSFDTGAINIERELPNGGRLKFSILNVEISYETIDD